MGTSGTENARIWAATDQSALRQWFADVSTLDSDDHQPMGSAGRHGFVAGTSPFARARYSVDKVRGLFSERKKINL